ncbi:MAG TPA: hypothetical protein PKY77_03590 [Phycisphaerae bacterium]|nr:hypothetical protein [Phycisphaerae bacterium]HRY67318.1 hypothetical protein [Phycisphaerae bacterium]HSA28461.1 hypothetical protein [Phycisphaerae bacterium]
MSTSQRLTTKDFAIGVLSITAVILLTAILLLNTFQPRTAMAFAQTDRTPGYTMSSAQLDGTTELLLVVSERGQKMNVYAFNKVMGRIDMIQGIDLERTTEAVQKARRLGRGVDRPGEPAGPARK